MGARMIALLERLNPFKTAEARRLALLFGVVYFAQGMWYLPNQAITIVLKDRGLSAGQVADFFLITMIPWLLKPVYGLLSDFVPLFGRRRQSYFLLMCALAAAAGLLLASSDPIATGDIQTIKIFGVSQFTLVAGVGLFTVMALGLAFTDVLTDAMMVETGRPRGLTGAFQSAQWGSSLWRPCWWASWAATWRRPQPAPGFPSCRRLSDHLPLMALPFVREPATRFDQTAFVETWARDPRRPRRAGALARRRLHLLLLVQPVLRAGVPLLPDGHAAASASSSSAGSRRSARSPASSGPCLRAALPAPAAQARHQPRDRPRRGGHARVSPLSRAPSRP